MRPARDLERCIRVAPALQVGGFVLQTTCGVHPKSETLRMLQSSRGGRDEETRPTIIERRETCDSFSD